MKTIFLLSAIMLSSIAYSHAQNLSDLAWLSGDWIFRSGDSETTESWSYMNDSTLVGSSLTMENGEMNGEEALRIELRNGSVKYIAILPQKIAIFSFKSKTKNSYSFSDPTNEFPKDIRYEKTKDGLAVTLTGKDEKVVMNFKRRK